MTGSFCDDIPANQAAVTEVLKSISLNDWRDIKDIKLLKKKTLS